LQNVLSIIFWGKIYGKPKKIFKPIIFTIINFNNILLLYILFDEIKNGLNAMYNIIGSKYIGYLYNIIRNTSIPIFNNQYTYMKIDIFIYHLRITHLM